MSTEPGLVLGEPFNLPLNQKQYDQLLNPENFGYKEQFYIYYELCNVAAGKFRLITMMSQLAKESGIAEGDLGYIFQEAVDIVTVGRWMYLKNISSTRPANGIFWEPKETSEVGVSWGRKVWEAIKNDRLLHQIWEMHLEYLRFALKGNHHDSFLDTYVGGLGLKDKARIDVLREKVQNDAALAKLDTAMIQHVVKSLRTEFWNKRVPAPSIDIEHACDVWKMNNANHIKKAKEDSLEKGKEIVKKMIDVLKGQGLDPGDYKLEIQDVPDMKNLKSPTHIPTSTNNEEEATTHMTTDLTKTKKDEPQFTNVTVMFMDDPNVKHIVLPQGMTYRQGREWLSKIEEEAKRTFAFSYKFKGWYPFDAMWAVYRSLAETYGFTHVANFNPGTIWESPPEFITVDVEHGKKMQIPWGPVEVHGLSAALIPNIEFDNGLPALVLKAEIRNNERVSVDAVMAKAEKLLEVSSLYRGKAIEVDFTIFNPRDIKFDVARAPKFMDTKTTKETDIILPIPVRRMVETNVWTPIRHTQKCRDQKIPLRRTTTLAGNYGVGKTLAALITAMLCEKHGWRCTSPSGTSRASFLRRTSTAWSAAIAMPRWTSCSTPSTASIARPTRS
jgi:hypothetical protein